MPTEKVAAVTVIGSYATAIVVDTDLIPVTGQTVIGRNYRETFGGKGSDIAVQAARLGAAVRFVGVIGDDQRGQDFLDLMSTEGIDVAHCRISAGRPTGVGLIIKDAAAHNVIVVDPAANDLLGRQDLDAAGEALSRADVVVAQLESPVATVMDGLTRAHAAGVRTVLNPAPAVAVETLTAHGRLDVIDVLTPNETEARVLLGLPADDQTPIIDLARRLQALGPRAVVITQGEEGADLVTAAQQTHVAALPVKAIDSNGAGDSFTAALSVALAEGQSLEEAARFAAATAGLCCEHWETVPSYQTRATVENAMKEAS
jgi:ribokinase